MNMHLEIMSCENGFIVTDGLFVNPLGSVGQRKKWVAVDTMELATLIGELAWDYVQKKKTQTPEPERGES